MRSIIVSLVSRKSTIFYLLIIPTALFFLGILFTSTTAGRNTTVAVYNDDSGYLYPVSGEKIMISSMLIKNLMADLQPSGMSFVIVPKLKTGLDMLRGNRAQALVIFTPSFSTLYFMKDQNRMIADNPTVEVRISGDTEATALKVRGALFSAIASLSGKNDYFLPVTVNVLADTPTFHRSPNDLAIAGFLGVSLFLFGFFIAFMLTAEKYPRGSVSFTPRTLFADAGLLTGVTVIYSALLLLCARFPFGFSALFPDRLIMTGIFTILLALASVGGGILAARLYPSLQGISAIMTAALVLVPTLTGALSDTTRWPLWQKIVSYVLPPSWFIDALRKIALNNSRFSELWPVMVALILFAGLFFIIVYREFIKNDA